MIVELVEGPLLNPKRLDEAIKASKFVRRLFSFYHPYNNRFSSIKRTRVSRPSWTCGVKADAQPNHKWVRLGCKLVSTMLSNPEGIKFITEDKLLRQLVECFNELDQVSSPAKRQFNSDVQYVGTPSAYPVFARDRVENSLTYGYFEMIGTLSKSLEGIK